MQLRIAPSLGGLEGDPHKVWGLDPLTNTEEPAVFFGLYGLPDFYELWRHKGTKYILWAGTDIVHFQRGYWLEDGGGIRMYPEPLARWINKYCQSWVENEVQRKTLESIGIDAQVCPSFMGNIEDYQIEYKPSDKPRLYLSVSGNNFEMYGWDIIERIADKCDAEFHLYGNTEPWVSKHKNVVVHGRVPKEQMNAEIKEMQSGLRLCMPDGFSEVLAKSVLWGQWPITWADFAYPFILGAHDENDLIEVINQTKPNHPNIIGRQYYKEHLNKYPWTTK